MVRGSHSPALLAALLLGGGVVFAQVEVRGRVVDETGAAVPAAKVEFRSPTGEIAPIPVFTDPAGSFHATLPASGEYTILAERPGFYLFRGHQPFEAAPNQLTITLNHVQEFSDRIDVTYSPPVIDPQQVEDRKEVTNTQALTVPFPASQDYRNALALMNGVVIDNLGRPHFNGGGAAQTNYTLDGFNISDPVTGRLEARLNVDTVQSMDLESSRFSAENGRGSAGVLDLQTKMGDDRWRFGGTNFIPGVSTESGLHLSQWSPRLEFSAPIAKGRAWFHNGFDGFYNVDVVNGLPRGQNRSRGLNASDLSRFQVNLTPANILTGSFLFNLSDMARTGLSILTPAEATNSHRQTLYMSTLRDKHYFGHGALLDLGFADSRGLLRDLPQGMELYQITPFGSRGNFFVARDRHSYRQQGTANLYLPIFHLHGTHQLKFGTDIEREAFHEQDTRHDYEVLRDDNSVVRYVTFIGNPFQERKNLEAAQYLQDHWNVRDDLSIEAGIRGEWNEIVRDLEWAPRFSVSWMPRFLHDTKVSAGWGIYYDAINLSLVSAQQGQASLSTFYLPGNVVYGPAITSFQVIDSHLEVPYYQTASIQLERRFQGGFYLKAGYTRRMGNRGFSFNPTGPVTSTTFYDGVTYVLGNTRRERYDAVDFELRHTFAGKYEWFAGYTRSSARSNAAMQYDLETPVFGPQGPGPAAWDAPNRFHMWGWLPLPKRILPDALTFLTRNTTVGYLAEYRTGFPFSVLDEQGFLSGRPNDRRFPAYANVNLAFERQFRAIHYLWAWRVGLNNVTNSGNPNVVNNVIGTAQFLAYGRGQARAFNVRLRFLGHA